MALKLSTGMRNAMLDSDGIKSTFNTGKINIYSGAQPADPDTAIAGANVLLATITVDAGVTGITFDAPAAGVVSKAAAEAWQGVGVADGTAAWFRMFVTGDNPATTSTTLKRIDGSIAVSGGDMNISNTAIVTGATQTITDFDITMPGS